MELIVLGSHGTWPSVGGATSGYLVRHDGFNLWVDMGTGTLANLQRHVGMYEVGAAFISHSHPDHVTDLFAYLFARMFGPERPPPIPLLLAPNILERAQPLLSDDTADIMVNHIFDVTELRAGREIEVGPFRIRTESMAHSVATMGIRVETAGRSLAYTADTGPSPEVERLAEGVDLLVAEASWQDAFEEPRPPIHLSATEAGEIAKRAEVGRLMLTHIRPHLDRDRSCDEAGAAFDGTIEAATDGLVREVGT